MGRSALSQEHLPSWLPSALVRGLSALGFIRNPSADGPVAQRMEAAEQARSREISGASLVATLLASFDDIGLPYYSLRIINRGTSPASDIALRVDGLDPAEHPALAEDYAPYAGRRLGPHSYFECPLAIKHGSYPSFTVEITWADEQGVPGSFRERVAI